MVDFAYVRGIFHILASGFCILASSDYFSHALLLKFKFDSMEAKFLGIFMDFSLRTVGPYCAGHNYTATAKGDLLEIQDPEFFRNLWRIVITLLHLNWISKPLLKKD